MSLLLGREREQRILLKEGDREQRGGRVRPMIMQNAHIRAKAMSSHCYPRKSWDVKVWFNAARGWAGA